MIAPPRPPQRARDAAALAAAYFALALASIILGRQPGAIAVVWFANAAGMAWLACRPRRNWPALLAAVAAANLAANLSHGDAFWLSASFVPGNLVEVLAGGVLLRHAGRPAELTGGAAPLLRVLLTGAVLPQLVGATIGAATLQWHGFGQFVDVWDDWYIGSAIGAMATLPLALTALASRAAQWRSQLLTTRVAAIGLLSVGVTVFPLAELPYPFVYLTLPLIAAALLLPPLASFALVLLAMLTISASLGLGLLAAPAAAAGWQHLLVFSAAVAAVLPAQLLTVIVERERRQARMLAGLTSATGDLSAFVDNDGIYRAVNRAQEQYFGIGRDAMIGHSMREIIPADRFDSLVRPQLQRALAAETVRFRADIDYPARGLRTVDVTYEPALDADSQQIGVLLTAHDVTDLVRAQHGLERSLAELRASNESLEQFVRIASHDLREPLNTIIQFCGLLREDHGAAFSGSAQTYFDHVQDGATRMRTMLDDVLAFVRLEPLQALVLYPVPLDDVLANAREALGARMAARGARIDVAPLPMVMGNQSLLALLFQNLLSNAVKFVAVGGTPQVSVSAQAGEDGERVAIVVADNGIGIAEAQQPLLFEPFKRLHSRRKFDGTGLGLAIAKRIAESHGGTIRIESQPGAGSRFIVTLQRAA